MEKIEKEYTHQEFWTIFNESFENNKEFSSAFNKRAAWDKVYYDLVWGNKKAHIVIRHLMNDHKFKLEIYIEDEKQSGLFKTLESCKVDIQNKFEEQVVFTPARITGDNTDSKARIIYIEKLGIKEKADDAYWNEQINWIQTMALKLKGIVDMYDINQKYSVNDAMWIATAIMAYEKYNEDPNSVSKLDMYFKQSKIVDNAQHFAEKNVDNARVSWWVNADNEKHTQNYLRADMKSAPSLRRLSKIDEFEEKCYPESLSLDDQVTIDGKTYKFGDLIQFVREEYPLVINKKSPFTQEQAIWISVACMAYENCKRKQKTFEISDVTFSVNEIVDMAEKVLGDEILNDDLNKVTAHSDSVKYNYLVNYKNMCRVSYMGEFAGKTECPEIETISAAQDVMITGKKYSLPEVYSFINVEYTERMRQILAAQEINYIAVLDYLENNQEIPYSNPDAKDISDEKRQELLEIKQRGQDAVAEMKKIAKRCDELYGLDKCMPGSWLDGSNTKTRKYLWTQMKYKDYADNPISVSLFVEINENIARYRVSLEIKNDGTDKQTMEKYHSFLEIPAQPGMVFVAGSNEWGNPAVIEDTQESIKKKVESGEIKKVQLCIYVEPETGKTNHQYDLEIMEAVKKVIPYYEYVIGKQSESHRAWLFTWNPANWPWEDYKEQCIATKKGDKFTIGWTCSSKQPEVGDELYLIKTGEQPRGIIAHGHISKDYYIAPHYDPEKAKQGATSGHIDAEYDWIQDYESESMLLQDDLKEMFPAQQWSPMGSGIEIKNEYVEQLDKIWKKMIDDTRYWPSLEQYNPGITKEKWIELLTDTNMTSVEDLRFFKCWELEGGESTCANAAEKYGGTASMYNMRGSNYADKVKSVLGIEACDDNGKVRTFPIVFQGRDVIEKGKKRYSWKLRKELKEALEDMDLSGIEVHLEKTDTREFDKNMILYGPPGTGKTYNTAIYSVAICKGMTIENTKKMPYEDIMDEYEKLKKSGRIAFTTFHQSYGYEEFIEGIKPIVDQTKNEVGYTIEPGVFKKFCDDARTIENNGTGASVNAQAQVWKLTIKSGDMNPIKQECFEEGNARMGFDYDAPDARAFVEEVAPGDIILSFKTRRTIDGIAVVTGDIEELASKDIYQLSRKVTWLAKDIDEDITNINAGKLLHRMTFAKVPNMQLKDILAIADKYSLNGNQTEVVENVEPYVFIIDEINRGNISKIFGELITLIENTKRAGMIEAASAILPYSGEPFSVPANVYILGTMNTADRSIALMDTALRRRFYFEEMMPQSQVLRELGADIIEEDGNELDVANMLDTINKRIEFLFDREHTIGHAFFTGLKDEPTVAKLASIFKKSIIPLLQEYFYEDYSKIMLVLGDNGKENDAQKFILATETKANLIFKGDTSDVDIPDYSYKIQDSAFYDIRSYIEITD